MGLADDFEASYSAQKVIELTNPNNSAATAKDSTRLAIAASHAEAKFEVIVGLSYDSTDTTHVAYGVEGVALFLKKYADHSAEYVDADLARWEKNLKMLGERKARFIPLPQTTSNLVPTRETTNREVRPTGDRSNFNDLIPNQPGSTLSGSNRNV